MLASFISAFTGKPTLADEVLNVTLIEEDPRPMSTGPGGLGSEITDKDFDYGGWGARPSQTTAIRSHHTFTSLHRIFQRYADGDDNEKESDMGFRHVARHVPNEVVSPLLGELSDHLWA